MGKLKPNKIRISAPCYILSQPQLIFLNFLAKWEFYPFPPQKAYRVNLNRLAVDSFNSQWDGILHPKSELMSLATKVSIPNGMKFYISLLALISPFSSFNSQRDEILPNLKITCSFARMWFQFPTGWNSTLARSKKVWFSSVSIPNRNPAKDFKWKAVKFNAFLLLGNNP